MAAGVDEAVRPKLGVDVKVPKWASVFGEAPRAINLAPRSGWRHGDGKGGA
jgi:hypothetical protein